MSHPGRGTGQPVDGAGPGRGRVSFVGAGPGAADLITVRGAAVLAAADVVIWASSLVHPAILDHARDGAELIDSAALPLEGVEAVYRRAAEQGLHVARVHSGDPALWGAVQEQLEICDRLGLDSDIVPGVSSFTALAAALRRELTVPEVAQSVILTRLGGGKTPMPPGEEVRDLARHGTTMALFLSAARSGQLRDELLAGGYPPDTPCVVAYQVSWPDELIVRCTLDTLADTVKAHRLWKHTLVLVGPALVAGGRRSHLYHPGHFHTYRRAQSGARTVLRDADRALAAAGATQLPASPHPAAPAPAVLEREPERGASAEPVAPQGAAVDGAGLVALVAVTAAGRAAAGELTRRWPTARLYPGRPRDAITAALADGVTGIVCFLATGATVRLLDGLLRGKDHDPGVVCVDEARRFAVALCGGHAGGANRLAEQVADALGATPVITTASDATGVSALDGFGAELGFTVEPGSELAAVGTAVLSGHPVALHADAVWPLPPLPPSVTTTITGAVDGGAVGVEGTAVASIHVTDRLLGAPPDGAGPRVVYRPPSLVVGVGASRGAPADEIDALVDTALAGAGLSPLAVTHLASVTAKADEVGLLEVARRRGWPLVVHPPQALAVVTVPHPSEVVRAAVGTPSVAEAASLLPAPPAGPPTAATAGIPDGATAGAPTGVPAVTAQLVVAKQVSAHATVAVARHRPRGRLAVVGLGPGDRRLLTPAARAELARARIVVGLDQYVRSVADLLPAGVTVLDSGLGDEQARAETAVAHARAGHAVALIGSGDAGVYAMGSPALDLADGSFDVVAVPGVTAALAAAALLGAPLGHDHALISLSDLHTPWERIVGRVRAVAEADLVVAFYNPRSRTRRHQLPDALDVLAAHRSAGTPVGIVTDAFRPGQRITVTTLGALTDRTATQDGAGGAGERERLLDLVGMTTTVVVGSSQTRLRAGLVVTPRDYTWR